MNETQETTTVEITLPVDAAETTETTETTVAVDADRLFLSTSFEDYTVTEGFLLLIFVLVLLTFFLDLFRR